MGNEAPLIEGLDPARVGEALMRLPAAAAMLRHANLQSTLSYVAEGDQERSAGLPGAVFFLWGI